MGPNTWSTPLFLEANNLFFAGDPVSAISMMSKVIDLHPEDWWAYNIRGSYYLLVEDLSSAREDFASSISLEPLANFPYIYSSLVAFHEARLEDAKKSLEAGIQKFPDPTYAEKIIYAYTGTQVDYPNLDELSAFGRLALGQYSDAITIADKGIQIIPLSDLYFIKGTAQCNLKQYKEAEESYTKGLKLDPEYGLLYILRADVRTKQGNLAGAQSDLTSLQSAKQFPLFAPYLQNPQAGSFTCETLFGTP